MSRNFIVIDTEGVDVIKRNGNDVHPETSLFYDLGFIVANDNDGILYRGSYINSDVFFQVGLMESAYYADKLPQYRRGMGIDWEVASTLAIMRKFRAICSEYDVKSIWAYNAKYDRSITNNTVSTMSNGFVNYFTPYKTKWRDIWDYAGSTICNTKKYVHWCFDNGFVTDSGNPSTSADTVGKYILNDLDFTEQHTALSDCEIELAILLAAKRRKQKARKSMGQGWRDAANIRKQIINREIIL